MRGVLTDSAELESSKSIGVPSSGDSAEFVVGVLRDSAEFESTKSIGVSPIAIQLNLLWESSPIQLNLSRVSQLTFFHPPSAIQLNSLWESSSWESSPIQLNRS